MKVELLSGHISAEFIVSQADNRIKKYVKKIVVLIMLDVSSTACDILSLDLLC